SGALQFFRVHAVILNFCDLVLHLLDDLVTSEIWFVEQEHGVIRRVLVLHAIGERPAQVSLVWNDGLFAFHQVQWESRTWPGGKQYVDHSDGKVIRRVANGSGITDDHSWNLGQGIVVDVAARFGRGFR